MDEETKTCTRCGETKSVVAFRPIRVNRRGNMKQRVSYSSRCRACLHKLEKIRTKHHRRTQTKVCYYCGDEYDRVADGSRIFLCGDCACLSGIQGTARFHTIIRRVAAAGEDQQRLLDKFVRVLKERELLLDANGSKMIYASDFLQVAAQQKFLCAICKRPPNGIGSFVIDHDHTTLEARGLLCQQCNFGVGSFKDSPKLLLRAAVYLQQYGK